MKTSELTGKALNWAVGVADGIQWESDDPEVGLYHRRSRNNRLVLGALDYDTMDDWGLTLYSPSMKWAQGGPIIEREGISIVCWSFHSMPWKASIEGGTDAGVDLYVEYGHTPLIAAMRCYVASKLGDDIEIPKELT